MLATQTPDTLPEAKDVKQRIKERLALSLKALQKCYVTSDDVVTSEDGNANLLCSALEAIFIHGIKSKHIRSEAGVRGRKGARGGSLPQPVFWNLLKTVTHRDVITELEKLSFVGSDVGRCRAWLRLALNHGLLECYLVSLFREGSKLQAHYQPSALLLDAEEREVLLSYLQGLASLAFSLSYKSAVLNEWTTTPLALAGLCPASQADAALLSDPPVNGTPGRKESWDTVSQSSSSGASDTVDVQRGGSGRSNGGLPNGRTGLNSSNLSLDTTGSSQLSSSLSSDSLLQEQDTRSPVGEQWSSCDLDISHHSDGSTKPPLKDKVSQDSMREEDSFASSAGPDPNSEAATFSGSDGESQSPAAPFPEPDDPPSEPLPQQPQPPSTPLLAFVEESLNATSLETKLPPAVPELVTEPEPKSEPEPEPKPEQSDQTPPEAREQKAEVEKVEVEEVTPVEQTPEPLPHMAPRRTTSVLSRKMSSDSVSHPYSWISEDDIYKPHLEELSDQDDSPGTAPDGVNKLTTPSSEPSTPQSPPSVVHRRQKGLANPFRGLLKLGHLERRSAVGRWRDHYCELSPFEFRLYQNAEERTCCDNHYLMRCEDARITSPEGRFELAFSGKRLYLRAANRDEAEDWVDRIVEATEKCRPAPQPDEQWEVLQAPRESGVEDSQPPTPSSTHASPERGSAVAGDQAGARGPAVSPPPLPPTQELDWSRSSDIEPDAIKESVLYLSTDPEARVWAPLVFSLSLEALKGFRLQDGRKALRLSHPIAGIRDVVPDVSLGGADFFKLLTVRETLKLRAKSPEEARSWRGLIRETLDSYLESGEDGDAEEVPAASMGTGGNITRLVQHRLKEDGLLLKYLCTVASEKGLDSQGFKCAGCPKKIGLSMGRARLCEFSAQYYCESCHRGDTTIIPARMVHNWDIEPREVSRKALKLLAQVEQEPLLNVDQLNPDLVEHTESMAQAYDLRQRLRLLGDYLLTCRSGTSKKIQSKLGQRSYLLETSQLYSVLDLRQIAEGQYAAFLSSLVQVASNHVHHCDLCTQRGFICQICHADDIIFPFQFDSTVRCKDCKSVFHIACKARSPSCPRCVRLQSYLERHMQD